MKPQTALAYKPVASSQQMAIVGYKGNSGSKVSDALKQALSVCCASSCLV
jgi:hypothetical protein